jgi:hypothetical protein
MSVLVVVLLGVLAGLAAAALGLGVARTQVPMARARRVALAAGMGGAIAFTLTALVQLPFYAGAEDGIAVPLLIACAAGAVGACMTGGLILRAAHKQT